MNSSEQFSSSVELASANPRWTVQVQGAQQYSQPWVSRFGLQGMHAVYHFILLKVLEHLGTLVGRHVGLGLGGRTWSNSPLGTEGLYNLFLENQVLRPIG